MIAGAAFAANVLLYSQVGYFDPPAETKPLLHLWSLGVEEQFYIVFPLLLLLIWRSRFAILIMVLLAIASFVANVTTATDYPAFSFYLPMTRFWEFLAGAALAYAQFAFGRPSWLTMAWGRLRCHDMLAGLGLLIVLCFVFIPIPSALFRSWATAAPIVGAFSGQSALAHRAALHGRRPQAVGHAWSRSPSLDSRRPKARDF